MKIGDLVKCRPRNEWEHYDEWLGLVISAPPLGRTVEWVNSDDGRVERVNHSPEELVLVNENR
mgnify:FL=1